MSSCLKLKDPFQIATMLQTRYPRDFLNHEQHLRRTVQLSDIPLLLTYVSQSISEFFDLFYSKTDKSELRGVCAVCLDMQLSLQISSVFARFDFFIWLFPFNDPRFLIISIRKIYRICSELARIFVTFSRLNDIHYCP